MARKTTTLTIFVSCPSDLSPEKKAIINVVDEVNRTIRSTQNIQFEVWDWSRDAMLGLASSAQAHIDGQIPDHDVYLGMMWQRFGAPTEGVGSGTEHEFNNSKKSHLTSGSPRHVMFAFKTGIDSLSELNTEEYVKVERFRKDLAENGILYIPFESQLELEKMLLMNLMKIALSWPSEDAIADNEMVKSEGLETEIEYGILDLQEIIEDSTHEASNYIESLTEALCDMADTIGGRAQEMTDAAEVEGTLSVKIARLLTNQAAADMEGFSKIAQPILMNAEQSFQQALDAFPKLIAMRGSHVTEEDRNELKYFDGVLMELYKEVEGAEEGMQSLASSVIELPKLTVRFNKARKKILDFTDSYSRMTTNLKSSIDNVRRSIVL